LVELLAVIAIVAVLAALLFAVAGPMTDRARAAESASKMRQAYVGIQSFLADSAATTYTLYDFNGVRETRWSTPLIESGRMRIADLQDPVTPASPNDASQTFGVLMSGPSTFYSNYSGSGNIPRGVNANFRAMERPSQAVLLGTTIFTTSGRQYASLYHHSSPFQFNLPFNGKGMLLFWDGHTELVDGPGFKKAMETMFGSPQQVTVFNGKQSVVH
jgi:prepilin-type processing-associated H-X9-DG protein